MTCVVSAILKIFLVRCIGAEAARLVPREEEVFVP